MAKKRSDRWPGLFRGSSDALFLLNARRQILYVNPAWERLTNLVLADVRGQSCKRSPRPEAGEPFQLTLAALAPPTEVLEGNAVSLRRRLTIGSQTCWWQISFLPLRSEDGLGAILGKISPAA